MFDGDGLKDLTKVTFGGKPLAAEVAKDGKSLTVKGLVAAGVTAKAMTVSLVFWFGTTKVSAKVDIVSGKVETVAR